MKEADYQLYVTQIRAELKKGLESRWPYKEKVMSYFEEVTEEIMTQIIKLGDDDYQKRRLYKYLAVGFLCTNLLSYGLFILLAVIL